MRCLTKLIIVLCATAGLLFLQSCSMIRAGGTVAKGTGEGLKKAGDDQAEGSGFGRLLKFGGKVTSSVGQGVEEGVDEDIEKRLAQYKRVYVAKSTANLRKGPGEQYPVLGTAKKDDTLVLLSEQDPWYLVYYMRPNRLGLKGYVYKSLTTSIKPASVEADEAANVGQPASVASQQNASTSSSNQPPSATAGSTSIAGTIVTTTYGGRKNSLLIKDAAGQEHIVYIGRKTVCVPKRPPAIGDNVTATCISKSGLWAATSLTYK